jgi:hypothetical protein
MILCNLATLYNFYFIACAADGRLLKPKVETAWPPRPFDLFLRPPSCWSVDHLCSKDLAGEVLSGFAGPLARPMNCVPTFSGHKIKARRSGIRNANDKN